MKKLVSLFIALVMIAAIAIVPAAALAESYEFHNLLYPVLSGYSAYVDDDGWLNEDNSNKVGTFILVNASEQEGIDQLDNTSLMQAFAQICASSYNGNNGHEISLANGPAYQFNFEYGGTQTAVLTRYQNEYIVIIFCNMTDADITAFLSGITVK